SPTKPRTNGSRPARASSSFLDLVLRSAIRLRSRSAATAKRAGFIAIERAFRERRRSNQASPSCETQHRCEDSTQLAADERCRSTQASPSCETQHRCEDSTPRARRRRVTKLEPGRSADAERSAAQRRGRDSNPRYPYGYT